MLRLIQRVSENWRLIQPDAVGRTKKTEAFCATRSGIDRLSAYQLSERRLCQNLVFLRPMLVVKALVFEAKRLNIDGNVKNRIRSGTYLWAWLSQQDSGIYN